jgi:hypothetical protein
MHYKHIDATKLRLEYACPFCLSAKFAESATLFDHVRTCPGATAILTSDDLADVPNLQIGEGLTMTDYIVDEETYYKNMVQLSSAGCLAQLAVNPDETLAAIRAAVDCSDIQAWRIMVSFFDLDDAVMEEYLGIIYGREDDADTTAAAPATPS